MLAQRSFAPASRARSVSVVAKQQNVSVPQAAVTIAASFVLAASPAFAGVVLEQPQLKKVFQAESTPAAAPSAPKAKAAAAPAAPKEKKAAVAETSDGGITPQSIALPAALIFVGGGAFALTTLDSGFAEFMRTAAVKDSSEDGAGYETDLKALVGAKPKKAGTSKTGTAKVKKAASTKGKSAAASPLSSLFGDK
ncbi:hypothetical protein MNEG_13316 [Monoraphidium neglectum]|uniref:Uncharacterized protein n=1 Tax=Monoraphidium neglectum TaxID=145388 RepID=A0A0D2LZ45_9CHLO|nr:hypothetical protein MNEG_13316 [Monoraphidium neglectum]KIY94646.1 hypothetical protein MNEG_13316 [Monoraphidium neglectum]|eukprot:XP_013893666.1 hypothetical protein MNEG_13316 [Monoraphidium neglectum]